MSMRYTGSLGFALLPYTATDSGSMPQRPSDACKERDEIQRDAMLEHGFTSQAIDRCSRSHVRRIAMLFLQNCMHGITTLLGEVRLKT